MMLFKLSLKNIKKSIKDYAIYFFTLILGVAIFYVFNSLDSQTVMLQVSKSTNQLIDLMIYILSGVSVFVSFVLGFLVIYASRFLIKRRNKEFGIYLTLGMGKGKVSKILLIETILIGIISLVIGLVLGVVASQGMSVLVANLFEANMENYSFIFSKAACIKTLIYFGIMYLSVMLFNTYSVNKYKLIDLLYASKKTEKIKLKNPLLCTIIFIISCFVLGYAYYMVTVDFESLRDAKFILIPITLGSVSTFFIFWSLSGLILKIVMSLKKVYYKGLNSFIVRQVSSKVNTTVFSVTLICLMLFVTICALSSALSIKKNLNTNLLDMIPADFQINKRMNLTYEDFDNQLFIENSKLSIEEFYKKYNVNIDLYLKDKIKFNVYGTKDFLIKDFLGSDYKEIKEKYPFMSYYSKEKIMKLSDYNKIAKLHNKKQFQLNNDEYIVIADFDSMIEIRNIMLNKGNKINIFGYDLKPKYNECQSDFIDMASSYSNTGVIVVNDNIVDDRYIDFESLIANYNKNGKDEMRKIEDIMTLSNYENIYNEAYIDIITKIETKETGIGISVLVTFIALYLGIIFLISSAAILALKELSESTDNVLRFNVLRKIGVSEKMINKALFYQIIIFFLFPLMLAIIHSIFGLKFSRIILEFLGKGSLGSSISLTAIFLIFIYGGYFLITYLCSKNIIRSK